MKTLDIVERLQDSTQHICHEAADTITELRKKVEELNGVHLGLVQIHKDIHALQESCAAMTKERDFLLGKILLCDNAPAAKDAVIAKLREALWKVHEFTTNDIIDATIQQALAILNDDTALKERLAQERERIAAAIDGLYDNCCAAKIREMK